MDAEARHAAWVDAWRALGVACAGQRPLRRAAGPHREPHRAYHTLQHLDECLDGLARERGHAERPAEIALALWFHDAIYDAHRHDNEERSADWARQALRAAGVGARGRAARPCAGDGHAPPCAARRRRCAIAGRHRPVDPRRAARRFAEYEQQIRVEYAHVPPEVFEPRRRTILGGFLARDPLYLTPSIRVQCETQARINLRGGPDRRRNRRVQRPCPRDRRPRLRPLPPTRR